MPALAIRGFAGSAPLRALRATGRAGADAPAVALFRCEREMSLAFDVKRPLQLGGALAFIVLSALSAAQSRNNPLAEAYVLGLICVSTIGLVVGAATLRAKLAIRSERGSRHRNGAP